VGEIGQLVGQVKEDSPLPAIEMDIILEKIRRLYEEVRMLDEIPAVKAHEPIPESVTEEIPVALTEDDPTQAKEIHEPLDEMPDTAAEKHGPDEEAQESIANKKMTGAEPEILADRYKNEKRFISETLFRKDNKQDLTAKLQSTPIKNIHSALGINDRFKLINTLFSGDKESFERTIRMLDDAGNFNDAFTYINSSFDWDMEDESVQMLLDLVRRKFIVNKDE